MVYEKFAAGLEEGVEKIAVKLLPPPKNLPLLPAPKMPKKKMPSLFDDPFLDMLRNKRKMKSSLSLLLKNWGLEPLRWSKGSTIRPLFP